MKLSGKLLVRPGKKVKLKDWKPGYDAGRKKEDVERELIQFSTRMTQLQYKLLQIILARSSSYYRESMLQGKMERFVM